MQYSREQITNGIIATSNFEMESLFFLGFNAKIKQESKKAKRTGKAIGHISLINQSSIFDDKTNEEII